MPYDNKFSDKLHKMQEIFTDDLSSKNIKNNMVDIFSKFMTPSITLKIDSHKVKGYSGSSLFSMLVFLPYLSVLSIWDLVSGDLSKISEAGKDAYYDFKRNFNIDWRGNLYFFVKRYLYLSDNKCQVTESLKPKCLIIDDTLFEKTGKTIEGISYVWDHVIKKSVLGFKALFLGYYDGENFIPINFSLHNELGKKESKPFGLNRVELKKRTSIIREAKSHGQKRLSEARESKITKAIEMIKDAIRRGILTKYVLADSWFICEEFMKEILNIKKQNVNVIGLWRLIKHRLKYNGKEYTSKQLKVLLERKKGIRSKKIRANYFEVIIEFKGLRLKLFYVRYHGVDKWNVLVSTDLSLNFNKAIEIYNIRWSIEVFFKEAKQNLNLGKEQSNSFDAQIADTTIKAIQYIMLTMHKKVNNLKTVGELFRHSKNIMSELTLYDKLWKTFVEIINLIIELFGIDFNDIMEKMYNDEKYETKIIKICNAIDEENRFQRNQAS